MRLFVAILLEPPLLDAIGRIQARLRRLDASGDVRWVDPAGIHLTLKFLGEVAEARLGGLEQALEAALQGLDAPRLGLAGMGGFPNLRRPRVLWVGVREEGSRLGQVHSRVEAACASSGWETEGRSFQPHLTVGRIKDRKPSRGLPPSLDRALREGAAAEQPSPLQHRQVALMRSHLSPRGARYEALKIWNLAPS